MKLIAITFLVLLVLTPCLEQQQTPVPSDFAALQKLSIEELQLKTEAQKSMGTGQNSQVGSESGFGRT